MAGKRGLIMGVANDRSLAWGIAAACAAQGAELAFTYQGEALERRVRPLAESVGADLLMPCNVTDDASMDAAFATLAERWGEFDFLVHAVSFADKQYLRGMYMDTPRAAFLQAMDISCFSFTDVCRRAAAMMRPGGAMLTLTYLGAERVMPHYNVMGVAKAALEASVRYLAAELGSKIVVPCDVTEMSSMDATFETIAREWGSLDFVVHAIAFSDKDELQGRYVDTSPDNFTKTMFISVYSFTAVAQRAEKLMTNGGSMLTLTYYGAEKWMPHYNVMGVAKAGLEASVRYMAADLGKAGLRVNAISAGPIKTLAASGIGDFRYILKWNQYNAPLRRNTTIEEVGGAGLYLLSDLSGGVTGEIHHVDSGYHTVGMKHPDAPDIAVAE